MERGRRFTNLLADFAALLGQLPVRVGNRGELGERRLLGRFEAAGKHEDSEDHHYTHGDRVHIL